MKINGNIIALSIYNRLQIAQEEGLNLGETWELVMALPELQALINKHQQREKQNMAYRCMSASETRKDTWGQQMKVFDVQTPYNHAQTSCVVADNMAEAEEIFKKRYGWHTKINSITLHADYVLVKGIDDKENK